LKRIGDQEEIQSNVQTQKQQLNRVQNIVDLNRRRTGRDIKDYLKNDQSERDIAHVQKLISTYKKNIPDQNFNPYRKFIDEQEGLLGDITAV